MNESELRKVGEKANLLCKEVCTIPDKFLTTRVLDNAIPGVHATQYITKDEFEILYIRWQMMQ